MDFPTVSMVAFTLKGSRSVLLVPLSRALVMCRCDLSLCPAPLSAGPVPLRARQPRGTLSCWVFCSGTSGEPFQSRARSLGLVMVSKLSHSIYLGAIKGPQIHFCFTHCSSAGDRTMGRFVPSWMAWDLASCFTGTVQRPEQLRAQAAPRGRERRGDPRLHCLHSLNQNTQLQCDVLWCDPPLRAPPFTPLAVSVNPLIFRLIFRGTLSCWGSDESALLAAGCYYWGSEGVSDSLQGTVTQFCSSRTE